MTARDHVRAFIARGGVGRLVAMPVRFMLACRYYTPRLRLAVRWTLQSREFTNFTYEYTAPNRAALAQTLAVVTDRPVAELTEYLDEAPHDDALIAGIQRRRKESRHEGVLDPQVRLGRQLVWYALVRAMRPRCVVETGVGMGLSAVVIARALARNSACGEPGKYIGIDLDLRAGALLGPEHREVAQVITGDSLSTLKRLSGPVDLFITDSHVSPELELAECRMVAPKLSERAIVATTYSSMLPQFAQETGRHALVFREEPKDHWYPGGWLGFAFSPRREPPTC